MSSIGGSADTVKIHSGTAGKILALISRVFGAGNGCADYKMPYSGKAPPEYVEPVKKAAAVKAKPKAKKQVHRPQTTNLKRVAVAPVLCGWRARAVSLLEATRRGKATAA